MTKKLVKKAQLDTGSEEGRGWGGLFRTKQNISQSVKRDFFLKKKKKKQHCAAVFQHSFSASLTEWQSNATLWMKLCLISSWMQTSQIDTHGYAKQTKQKRTGQCQEVSQMQATHSYIPLQTTHFRLKYKLK